MNRSKNDHIIEMAKKFIDNCNSFEIKDLDADKQYLNNLPAITPFTDRIKEYLTPFEEEQNQNLTKTSSNDLDELCIFEKDMFKLFCTDEFNTYLIRMVNSFVIKAVNGGKRVLIISPFSNAIVRNFLKAVGRKNHQNNLFWFDDKKLYFCECMPDDNIIAFTEDIKSKILDLNIDIVYIPYLEGLLKKYSPKLQIDVLKYFYDFAFDKKICIVSTLSSFEQYKGTNDDCLFYPQHKLDVCVLGKILPMEALYITSFSNNTASFENWSVWNYINDTPSKVSVQSLDNFYTFDSIKINDEEFNNMQL